MPPPEALIPLTARLPEMTPPSMTKEVLYWAVWDCTPESTTQTPAPLPPVLSLMAPPSIEKSAASWMNTAPEEVSWP